MNAKLAKRLRRAASNATQTLPAKEYMVTGRTVISKPNTTRGLYLDMKRNVRAMNLIDSTKKTNPIVQDAIRGCAIKRFDTEGDMYESITGHRSKAIDR